MSALFSSWLVWLSIVAVIVIVFSLLYRLHAFKKPTCPHPQCRSRNVSLIRRETVSGNGDDQMCSVEYWECKDCGFEFSRAREILETQF